jgi:cytoskeletal protein RodZ
MEGRDRSAAGDGASGKDGGASRTFRLGEPSVSAGEMLLEARGVAGLSIDDVCRRTNISRGFVEAVETNNAEGLPPPFYLRSHVQKLCQLYEIDPEPVLERFESLSGAGARSASDHGRFAVEAREADENSGRLEHRLLRREDLTQDQVLRHLKWGTLGAAALVVILIVVAAGVRVLGPDPATETGVEVAPPTAATEELTVEDLMPPQQLPMHELPVPVP